MASVNKAVVLGNVGQDPKINTLNSGDKVASFTLATSESWKDKNTGERREKTSWHNIVIYNDGLVGVVEQYVKKGTKLYLEGQIQTRKYNTQNGEERYITEIVLQKYRGELVLLGGREGGGGESEGASQRERAAPRNGASAGNKPAERRSSAPDIDDDIPF